jgi:hypothetical protein
VSCVDRFSANVVARIVQRIVRDRIGLMASNGLLTREEIRKVPWLGLHVFLSRRAWRWLGERERCRGFRCGAAAEFVGSVGGVEIGVVYTG